MLGTSDFGDRAFVETTAYPPHEIPNGPGTTRTTAHGDTLEIEADLQGDGWVVVSQTAWKGWRAYLDGRRVETHFADHAFLGVFAPRGHHHIRLAYLPSSFTRGRAISMITAALLALAAVTLSWRRRASRDTALQPDPSR